MALGIVLLALNLRPALTSVPVLFPEIHDELGYSDGLLTLLAVAPVLTFAACSTLVVRLGRRHGDELVLALATALLAGALVGRALAPTAMLLPATVVAAAGITAINVIPTGLIKQHLPERAGIIMGAYLFALYAGGTLGTVVTANVYDQSGGSFTLSLGLWSIPAVIALIAWLPRVKAARSSPEVGMEGQQVPKLYRSSLAWYVAVYFGLQSMMFYSCISWLPTLFHDRGASIATAGFLASWLSIGGIATVLLVPVIAHRSEHQEQLVLPIVATCAVGLIGTLVAPLSIQAVTTAILGAGTGASMGLSSYLMVARAGSAVAAIGLSGMAQSAGYVLAGLGPLLVGVLHAVTGGWDVPISALMIVLALQVVIARRASRPLTVEQDIMNVDAARTTG